MKKRSYIILSIFLVILILIILIISVKTNKRASISNIAENVSIYLKGETLTTHGTDILIHDASESNYRYYNYNYEIQVWKNGKWVEIKQIDEPKKNRNRLELENKEVIITINWSSVYGNLENGRYRLVYNLTDEECVYTEFTIDKYTKR